MTRTTAIYARISDDRDDTEIGVARQVKLCKEWAASRGFTVTGIYIDNDMSASSGQTRPEFERLLQDRPDAVICYHLDRLLRKSSRELERVLDTGSLVHSLKGGDFDLATPTGRAMARTVVAWAENEVALKGERQKSANEDRMLSGRLYGRRLIHGWKDLQGQELDEPVAEQYRAGAQMVLSGASLRDVARAWNEAGFTTITGKPWTSVLAREALLRPMNAGIVAYKGEERRDVQALWTPMFDVETYDALKASLSSRQIQSNVKGNRARRYLMSGLARCGKCGSPMHASRTANSSRKQGYVCSGPDCYRTIDMETLDRFALRWTALSLLRVDPERFLSSQAVARLAEIDKALGDVQKDREEVAAASLSVSSRVALLADLDARESALRGEAADLTRDSAIAQLVRALTLPDDTGDVDTDSAAAAAQIELVQQRLTGLSLRQQRMVIGTFGSFTVQERGSSRVQVSIPSPSSGS